MRDMTPAAVAGFNPPREAARSGGADQFLAFLADELMPYLETNYRVQPMRVLVGHSLGGLFALYALQKRPSLFTGYLVMEPAVWWNNEHELNEARSVLATPSARRARLMLVNAPGLGMDTTRWGGDAPMVRELKIAGETHSSMAMAGMMLGLRTMFADFQAPEWIPGTRPAAMLARYDSLAARIGFASPIPVMTFEKVIRMSIHSRFFDDAESVLRRMEAQYGSSGESEELQRMLAEERVTPVPAGFVPLEIPPRRPGPRDAAAFLGRWSNGEPGSSHEVEVRGSGDTIIVHDRVQFPNGDWDESDSPVIQVTADGTLEWGLKWFRGIAALMVMQGKLQPDGTMRVTRQVRGWVPRGPGGDLTRVEHFRRMSPAL
jgi:pimeloyl-ACP methyl ester carboxylesterase